MKLILLLVKWIINLLFRVEVKGMEKLDFSRPMIIMPNHTSLLDAVILGLFLPDNVTFVPDTGIARRFSWVVRLRPHITVDPLNPYSVRHMVRVVNQNRPLVIFPEGRITTTRGLMKIYGGIGYIALRTGAQVYPVIVRGLERSKLSYLGDKIKTVWFPQVRLCVGNAFLIHRDASRPMRPQKKAATEQIYQILQHEWLNCLLPDEVDFYYELQKAAHLHGMRRVIAEDLTSQVTYRQLIVGSTVLSRKLSQLLAGHPAVGVLLPTSIGHVLTLFALFRAKIRPAILNFSQGSQTLVECCETAGIQTVVTSKLFVEKAGLAGLIEFLTNSSLKLIYLEDIKQSIGIGDKIGGLFASFKTKKVKANQEIILFTSGSEAKPKGVVLTHRNIYANVQQAVCVVDFTSKDKIFNAMPMFHSFGLTGGTFLPILTGVPTYLYPSPLHFKAVPELCYANNATILFGTSTFLAGYARFAHPYDFYSIRYVFAGAEKLKEEVRQLWMDKFGIRIFEGYGATETSPILALNTPLAYKKGTVGRLLPGIRGHIEQVEGIEKGGRLLVQGPNVMKGYLIHGKGFVPADPWYDTGDVVEQDQEGFLEVKARLKRFAKVGGEMVSLQQVEELAGACFGHTELAALSVMDPRKGERILLYTTHGEDSLESFRAYLSRHGYSPLLCPFKLAPLAQLPLLGSGKTDYVALKQMAAE